MVNIQWYPGHMAKAKKEMEQDLKNVDVIIEIVDARAPVSSRNSEIDILFQRKPRLIIMNKCELADGNITKRWINEYKNAGVSALDVDSVTGKNINKVQGEINRILSDKISKYIEKGAINRMIKIMVVGIPNVGKSAFINKISKKTAAKTGNKPGVTRSRQWIPFGNNFFIMDTPGVLWPKFESETEALHLAYIYSISDTILDKSEVALNLIKELNDINPEILIKRYNIQSHETPLETMTEIGSKRGCLISGGNVDFLRTSSIILDDFRSGRLGKISLEEPGLKR